MTIEEEMSLELYLSRRTKLGRLLGLDEERTGVLTGRAKTIELRGGVWWAYEDAIFLRLATDCYRFPSPTPRVDVVSVFTPHPRRQNRCYDMDNPGLVTYEYVAGWWGEWESWVIGMGWSEMLMNPKHDFSRYSPNLLPKKLAEHLGLGATPDDSLEKFEAIASGYLGAM